MGFVPCCTSTESGTPSPSVSAAIDKLKVTDAVPAGLVAVIVKVVLARAAVGVPEMAPVVVLNDNPAGKLGLIANELTVPPVELILIVVSSVFTNPL